MSDERAQAVSALVTALSTIAKGREPAVDPAEAFAAALAAAHEEGAARFDPHATAAPLDTLVGDHLRAIRTEAGIGQQSLADAMDALGFGWKRQTVAQVETVVEDGQRARKLSLGEILSVAGLFGVPALELLLPRDGEAVEVVDRRQREREGSKRQAPASRHLSAAAARELIVGRGGKVGSGGPVWAAAAAVVPQGVDRPARHLWSRRRAAERGE